MNDELEAFKTRVNLTEFAASEGFVLDAKASSRNSAVMRHPAGDKIIVGRGEDGHWIYFSVRDPADNGTIIDFVQRCQGGTLGQVRQVLRPWIGSTPVSGRTHLDPRQYVRDLAPVSRDLVSIRARFGGMAPIGPDNQFLVGTRRIPSRLLALPAVAETIRVDDRGNVCFGHYNDDGLCGYEIKNRGFTGFAAGGVKGLWSSRPSGTDRRLVVAETAIDALSHAALRGVHGRFASIAGQMNPHQPALLRAAMDELPANGCIALAFDNDAGGDALTEQVSTIFTEVGRSDITIVEDRPPSRGMDWNDVLRTEAVRSDGPEPSQ